MAWFSRGIEYVSLDRLRKKLKTNLLETLVRGDGPMKRCVLVLVLLLLSGCSALATHFPAFNGPNGALAESKTGHQSGNKVSSERFCELLLPNKNQREESIQTDRTVYARETMEIAYKMRGCYFYEIAGQSSDRGIRYSGAIPGGAMGFAESKIVMWDATGRSEVVLTFEGARDVAPLGVNPTEHCTNYFLGNRGRCLNVRAYDEVLYEDLWPGIDLIFYLAQSGAKYEFRLKPGAELRTIRICFDGHDDLLVEDNSFSVWKDDFMFIDEGLKASQGNDLVEVKFIQMDHHSVGFQIESYDQSAELVIDPLMYSTFAGGSAKDTAESIACDSLGNVYVVGETWSSDFPILTPYDDSYHASSDCFVFKLNSTGNGIMYATYIGGSGSEYAYSLAVDGLGNAYVTGYTGSSDFPLVNPYDDTNLGYDCFVFKLNASGNGLEYSTFVGGNSFDDGRSIATDASGNAYVTGYTDSLDFPTCSAYSDAFSGGTCDAFVFKLNSSGNGLLFSTFVGGNSTDWGDSIVCEDDGEAYVCGHTESRDFPVASAYDETHNGRCDVFVLKLSAGGDTLVYSTFVGGSSFDEAESITVDQLGAAYVTGCTSSDDFPILNAFDNTLGWSWDCFVFKLHPDGTSLTYSTFVGGSGDDYGRSIYVDLLGNTHVTGCTHSVDFPTLHAFNGTFAGEGDAFVFKLHSSGNHLLYSTYVGGNDEDWANSLAVDEMGHAYVTGYTKSLNFPVERGYNTTYNGGASDCFVFKLPDMGDSDADGISDHDENQIGTDRFVFDTDSDGMPDGWEVTYFLDPLNTSDASGDKDSDGLVNLDEYIHGADPTDSDSDNDTLEDGEEVHTYGTSPTDVDSDGDSIGDGEEINTHGTDPTDSDSDDDSLSDDEEIETLGTNPISNDTDGDGMPDGWEVYNLLNPLIDDSDLDADMDSLSNLGEFEHGTNPNSGDSDSDSLSDGDEVFTHLTDPTRSDTDDDAMPDGWEVSHGLNPLSDDSAGDLDSDELLNLQEFQHNTYPEVPDSDSDGLTDGEEVHVLGTNPVNDDTDNDGLLDGEEVNLYSTNPLDIDTDKDGYTDGEEIDVYESDPLDPYSPRLTTGTTGSEPPPIPLLSDIATVAAVASVPILAIVYALRRRSRIEKPSITPVPIDWISAPTSARVNVLRGCEVVGGHFEYKVKVVNNSDYVINNVTITIVTYPQDSLGLSQNSVRTIARIEPGGFRSPGFVFAPTKDCVEGNIQSTVSYLDHRGQLHTERVEPYTIRSVCDLLKPLEATVQDFTPILENMSSTTENIEVGWNAEVLFEMTAKVIPMRNFHIVDSKKNVIGGEFIGTINGLAEGKYTGNRVGVRIIISGSEKSNESQLAIEILGDDVAMLPTTIDEIIERIESWICLNCGGTLTDEAVGRLKEKKVAQCAYCRHTLTVDLYVK